MARHWCNLYVGNIAHKNWHPIRGCHDNALQIRYALRQTNASYCVPFRAVLDKATTKRGVVVSNRGEDVMKRQDILFQFGVINDHMELLSKTVPRVDFTHTFDRAQTGTHFPVVNRFLCYS